LSPRVAGRRPQPSGVTPRSARARSSPKQPVGIMSPWGAAYSSGGLLPASRPRVRNELLLRDHPLPSGCALGLRIDERREGGDGAPQPWRPREPPPRGSPVREDKESGRILIFPPAAEPANGRARPDSQGILVFPFRTTPRRSRRVAAAARAAAGRTRRELCRPCTRRAPHMWFTGAWATGMVMWPKSWPFRHPRPLVWVDDALRWVRA